MPLRSVLLASITAFLLAIGSAAAQQTGSGAAGTNAATGAASAPTSLLPEGGIGSGASQRTLRGSIQQEATLNDPAMLDPSNGSGAVVPPPLGDTDLGLPVQDLSAGIVAGAESSFPRSGAQPREVRQQQLQRR